MSDTKTPLTDAAARGEIGLASIQQGWYVHADFARSLERRLRVYMDAVRDAPHEKHCNTRHYILVTVGDELKQIFGECDCDLAKLKSRIAAELAKVDESAAMKRLEGE